MIEKLVIHRFRGIREGVIDDLGKVNLLIGPNNSGKTSILEMLYLGGVSGRKCGLNFSIGAIPATTLETFDFLGYEPLPRLRKRHGYKEYKSTVPATLSEECGLIFMLNQLSEKHPLHEFTLASPQELPGENSGKAFNKKDINRIALFSIDRQPGLPEEFIPQYFQTQKIEIENSRLHFFWEKEWIYKLTKNKKIKNDIDRISVWVDQGIIPDSSKILFFDFHIANNHFNDRFANWAFAHVVNWWEKISESLTKVFPEFKGATVKIFDAPDYQQGKAGYIEFPGKNVILIDQFGDGARHAFKVLASLIALSESVDEQHPGIFLWEDPELFMHPESLNQLLEEILHLTHNKPIQMFLSSQSLEVVGLLINFFNEKFTNRKKDLRAFRLELDQGNLYAAKYRIENLHTWLKNGMDPRFWGAANLPFEYRYHKEENTFSEEEI